MDRISDSAFLASIICSLIQALASSFSPIAHHDQRIAAGSETVHSRPSCAVFLMRTSTISRTAANSCAVSKELVSCAPWGFRSGPRDRTNSAINVRPAECSAIDAMASIACFGASRRRSTLLKHTTCHAPPKRWRSWLVSARKGLRSDSPDDFPFTQSPGSTRGPRRKSAR
jgi:hypothetical protein